MGGMKQYYKEMDEIKKFSDDHFRLSGTLMECDIWPSSGTYFFKKDKIYKKGIENLINKILKQTNEAKDVNIKQETRARIVHR